MQTEILVAFHNDTRNVDMFTKLKHLIVFSTIKARDEPMSSKRRNIVRSNFTYRHVVKKEFPFSAKCWLCTKPKNKGNAFARHHIIGLNNWGCNRPINIVSLCFACHALVHPWLLNIDLINKLL